MGTLGLGLSKLESMQLGNIFNGVFYNLDACVDGNHRYEKSTELYEFHEKIGEGGFSEVYRATFLPTDEEMAVKILKTTQWSDQVIDLFKQEAELLNRLDHPNVVKVHHLIQLNGVLYMGMECLLGGSLQSLIRKKLSCK